MAEGNIPSEPVKSENSQPKSPEPTTPEVKPDWNKIRAGWASGGNPFSASGPDQNPSKPVVPQPAKDFTEVNKQPKLEAPEIEARKALQNNELEAFKQHVIDWMKENPNIDPILVFGVALTVDPYIGQEQKKVMPQLIVDAKAAARVGGLEALAHYKGFEEGIKSGITQGEYDKMRDALGVKFQGVIAHLKMDLRKTVFGPKLDQLESNYSRRKILEKLQQQNPQSGNKAI